MKTESGSTRIRSPKSYGPAVSQLQSVDGCDRSCGESPSSNAKVTTAATKETPTDAVARYPAPRRVSRPPATVIASAAPRGASRQIQAATITSAAQRPELVHVQGQLAAGHGDDQAEPHDDLGGGDRHHGQREDLPVAASVVAREGDQRQVGAVEHQLKREQDDQRAAPDQHPEPAREEQERADAEVPDDVRPVHIAPSGFWGAAGGAGPEGTVLTGTGPESTVPSAASGGGGAGLRPAGAAAGQKSEVSREWAPRMTPPTAAIRSTIEVISN